MEMYKMTPEVAGGLGPRTIISNIDQIRNGAETIPNVSHLHYEFEDWLGDDLLESTPCFLVTDRLSQALITHQISGCKFEDAEISVSELFEQLNGKKELPKFVRLVPLGRINITESMEGTDSLAQDICVTDSAELVVSERCLSVMQQFNLEHCKVSKVKLRGNEMN